MKRLVSTLNLTADAFWFTEYSTEGAFRICCFYALVAFYSVIDTSVGIVLCFIVVGNLLYTKFVHNLNY